MTVDQMMRFCLQQFRHKFFFLKKPNGILNLNKNVR